MAMGEIFSFLPTSLEATNFKALSCGFWISNMPDFIPMDYQDLPTNLAYLEFILFPISVTMNLLLRIIPLRAIGPEKLRYFARNIEDLNLIGVPMHEDKFICIASYKLLFAHCGLNEFFGAKGKIL